MKLKLFSTLLTSLLVSVSLSAAPLEYGVQGGLNFIEFTGGGNVDPDLGFNVGGSVTLPLENNFSVRAELNYVASTVKDAEDSELKIKQDVIQLPVLLVYRLNPQVNLVGGAYLTSLLSVKAEYQGMSVDIKDLYNSTNFGLTVGAEYTISKSFALDARYLLGLTDLSKSSNSDLKESGFQFGARYSF